MSDVVVSVRNVGWRAGDRPILDGVTFDVRPAEFVAVMGRNGAGKSTLLDIIAGLRTPSTGRVVTVDGSQDRPPALARARVVAHLPQQVRADVAMCAEDLVLMGRYPHATRWFESNEDVSVAEEAMRRCECLGFRRRRLGTLSGGERQRVFLAACLAQRARVLLLDEPATFLDVDQQLHLFTVLQGEAARGTACLAVTHDVNLALTFCSRLVVIAAGSVACDLSADEALAAPDWLPLLSDRLHVATTPNGGRWVRYR
jgi:iron complex transport system ATP-binding protein